MGSTLTGTQIQNTYDSLIKVSNNLPIDNTGQNLSDGLGNDLPIRFTTSSTVFTSSVDFTSATVTGLPSLQLTNNTNDYLVTATGTSPELNGEGNLQFNTTTGLFNRNDYNSEGNIRIDGSITPSGSIIQRDVNASGDYSGVIQDWGAYPAAPTVGNVYYWTGTFWIAASNATEAAASGILMIATQTGGGVRNLAQGMMQATQYGFTTGDKLYLSTAGALTATPPTATGTFVRHVGWCIDGSARKIYFNPDNSYFENT